MSGTPELRTETANQLLEAIQKRLSDNEHNATGLKTLAEAYSLIAQAPTRS